MTTDEIIQILKNYKAQNQAVYNISKLGLFGSSARGENTDESDIDIVVELGTPKMFDLIGIKQDLEEITKKNIDVIMYREKMNPFLKKRIERDAIYV